MFFQVVIQNAVRRLNAAVPTPPQAGQAPRHRDKTGFIFVLIALALVIALAIAAVV